MVDSESKYDIKTFEDACDYVFAMSPEMEKTMRTVQGILANPEDYTGAQAAKCALQLSSFRYKIGQQAQHYKIHSAQTKRLSDRLTKDALMAAYDGLLEVINTLKITARYESDVLRNG
jgi:hypothetical protein